MTTIQLKTNRRMSKRFLYLMVALIAASNGAEKLLFEAKYK